MTLCPIVYCLSVTHLQLFINPVQMDLGFVEFFAILGGSYKLPHSNLLERYNADLAYNNFLVI